jgi:phosphatidylinositol 4-kinase type 2
MIDRGLDNWMIKICWDDHENGSPQLQVNGLRPETPTPNGRNSQADRSSSTKPISEQPLPVPSLLDARVSDVSIPRPATPRASTSNNATPHIHIGAIDNSLAFPWKHPDEWRSFPLYLACLSRV